MRTVEMSMKEFKKRFVQIYKMVNLGGFRKNQN